MLVKPS